jgi:hypothetical protein
MEESGRKKSAPPEDIISRTNLSSDKEIIVAFTSTIIDLLDEAILQNMIMCNR